MRIRAVWGLALLLAVAGCNQTAGRVAPPPGTYTVSALVESYADGTAKACRMLIFTMPGDCGDSIPLSQLGGTRLPVAGAAATRGAYLTPILKLTGTWTGSGLALTEPPTPAAAASRQRKVWSATQLPAEAQMQAGMPTVAGLRDQQALMADLKYLQNRGVLVLENGFNEAGLYIVVAVADPPTVDLLRTRYRVQEIDAWLQPAG